MELGSIRVTTPAGSVELSPDRSHVIGRGREADLAVADGKVSRRHVELVPGPAGWIARDLSSNGIWRDGVRAKEFAVDGEAHVRLGGSNGPEITLRASRPVRRPPAVVDNSEVQTVLSGQGRGPEPGRGPVPAPAAGGARAQPAGAASEPQGAPEREAGPVPALSGWLRMLPTLVWLTAVGFTLGALVALS
ncbi:FHA domain-containing protein [Parafrankia elaeagni]|uniref:FHA domain-containing protein n=1 Tax=Parafrankia elaeagni TaxID=222534 RepID=UPI00039C3290|nr:FHA domain-containing protein [Parafrankia elaeagni]